MAYILNKELFETLVKSRGFSSVSDFAATAGVHRNTLRAYLSGSSSVFASSFNKICEALEVDPLELIASGETSTAAIRRLLRDVSIGHPQCAFMLMGSRASGSHKTYSDWDIGITKGREKLSSAEYLKIKSHIQDLADDLPQSVDVVNLDQAPMWFLDEMDTAPQLLAGNRNACNYFLGKLDGIKKAAA